jgi:hypothetical protein
VHLDFKSKSGASNNRGNWNNLKITQKIPEQSPGKARHQGCTKNSYIGHCTNTYESTQGRQCMYKVTLWRVCETIVAAEKQQCIMCFCTLSHKLQDFREKKNIGHEMCVLIFSATVV